MAHIQKYKASSVGHMLAHYRRDKSSLGRENIDPKRSDANMVLGHYKNKDGKLVVGKVRTREGEPNWATVERRIERVNEEAKAAGKRATRKDAVVMADVVVTLPENVRRGDEGKFFRMTYWYLSKKFGIENMMGGFVHGDEVLKDGTPARAHMHVPFTPILDGRFNYKQMCPRTFYRSMHKELGDYLERALGYRPEIELGEETRARRVYADKSADIEKVRKSVDDGIVKPAEQKAAQVVGEAEQRAAETLRAAEERAAELDAAIKGKEEELASLEAKAISESDRLECLRQRADGVARDVEELRPIVADVRRFEDAGRGERRQVLDSIAAGCDGLAGRVRAAVAGIRLKVEELRSRISRPLEYLMPKPKAERYGIDDMVRDATRAAAAWNRSHAHTQPHSRSRGVR
jgi:vacuolar-type H+-ATPase subunit H